MKNMLLLFVNLMINQILLKKRKIQYISFYASIHDQEDLHVNTKEVKAIKEVRSDLNILKSQCGSKVKEYALERVRMITPESDLEV